MRVGYRMGMVLLVLLAFAVGESRLFARQAAWQPSPGHTQLPIWPGIVDAADKESCRPDFAVALYPGHLAVPEKDFALNPDIQVTSRTPPTFLLHAEDDPVDPVENSLVYYSALRKAGAPAEMHVYVKGGHAFGLRPTESPITRWPQLVETWLGSIGIITR